MFSSFIFHLSLTHEHFIIIIFKQYMKRQNTFFCIKKVCAFSVYYCLKRMCVSFICLGFMDFSELLWLFYELVEILLVLSSFKKKRLVSLFYTCIWLEFLSFRLINSSSIFSTLLASACPSHETKLDYIGFFFVFFLN